MSILTFPLLSVVFFGRCFDLIEFDLTSVYTYNYDKVRDYTVKSNIDTFTSEFRVVKTSAELANFLGMDLVSYLKRDIGVWQYGPEKYLIQTPDRNAYNKVTIIVRMSLRTVNETVSDTAPVQEGWESKQARLGGTHYLKSIIYGAEIYSVIEINAVNKSHYRQIRRAVNREIGETGTFDEYFKGKLEKIVGELDTWYGVPHTSAYGIKFDFYHNVNKLLRLKNNLEGNRSLVYDNTRILFEFHSLSEINSSFPSVEINGEVIKYLDRLRLIFEDVKIASKEFDNFVKDIPYDFIEEYLIVLSEFQTELESLQTIIWTLIQNVDITTEGSIEQFSELFQRYGSGDTKKYRHRIRKLIMDMKQV